MRVVLSLLELFARQFEAAAEARALQPGDSLERTVALWSAVHGARLVGKLARLDPEPRPNLKPRALTLSIAATLLRGWGAESTAVDVAQQWAHRQESP